MMMWTQSALAIRLVSAIITAVYVRLASVAYNFLGTILVLSLAGCWGAPLPTKNPFDAALLESLEGSDKREVIEKLGQPMYELSHASNSYFVYREIGGSFDVGFILYMPMYFKNNRNGLLYCVLMEFDEGDILSEYKVKTRSKFYSGTLLHDCRAMFWSEAELAELVEVGLGSKARPHALK